MFDTDGKVHLRTSTADGNLSNDYSNSDSLPKNCETELRVT